MVLVVVLCEVERLAVGLLLWCCVRVGEFGLVWLMELGCGVDLLSFRFWCCWEWGV